MWTSFIKLWQTASIWCSWKKKTSSYYLVQFSLSVEIYLALIYPSVLRSVLYPTAITKIWCWNWWCLEDKTDKMYSNLCTFELNPLQKNNYTYLEFWLRYMPFWQHPIVRQLVPVFSTHNQFICTFLSDCIISCRCRYII